MNSLQVKNIIAPIVGIIAAWLARKLPFVDAAQWTVMIDTTITFVVVGVLGWFNRTTNVLDTAGHQPGTTVITTPANANALPANPDVIAATPAVAAAVQTAKTAQA